MSIAPWNDLWTLDSAGCDNNRTSVIFEGSDNLSFVGAIKEKRRAKSDPALDFAKGDNILFAGSWATRTHPIYTHLVNAIQINVTIITVNTNIT